MRVFTRRGFLKKAGRTGVVSTYGLKTLMYGLILKGPEILKGNPILAKRIVEYGHELGIHGHDHVLWHDRIKGWDKKRTEDELEKAITTYKEVVGVEPSAFAAPGWMINGHLLKGLKEKGFIYTSNCRGDAPFFPEMEGRRFDIIEIPTTLPTLDEVIGIAGKGEDELIRFYITKLKDGLNILTIHTELEGKRWNTFLRLFIEKAIDLGYRFERLIDVAGSYINDPHTPCCRVSYGQVLGRAGEVCCQGSPL
jgi:peptidoglycan/xylan/chitin deacetylase (PgdA/CDA1 family)